MQRLYARLRPLFETANHWRKNRPIPFYFAIGTSALLIGAILCLLSLLLLTNRGHFGPAPSQKRLLHFHNDVGSEAFDRNGISLGRFYEKDRIVCEYGDLPQHLIDALIASEDARFYAHSGVDWRAYGRVAYKTLLLGQEDQGGGSTLSQQIIKNAYGRPELGYGHFPDLTLHKFREAILARRLERALSKEEIIERYLNTVSFPGNTYGIAAASRRYFQKDPRDLTLRESVALIASLKGNSLYDPRRSPERNAERVERILGQMVAAGYLTSEKADQALAEELCINYFRPSAYAGLASHFTLAVKKRAAQLAAEVGYDLYTDNLRVYTTLDLRLQEHAEAALREQLDRHQRKFDRHLGRNRPWATEAAYYSALHQSVHWREGKRRGLDSLQLLREMQQPVSMELPVPNGNPRAGEFSPIDSLAHALRYLRAGFLAVDHNNGSVLAWVGGPDFSFSQFDHVLSRRQTGSTFKPFVYAAALRAGYSPCYTLSNELTSYPDDNGSWTPRNSDGEYGGTYSMHGALSHSANTAAVQMIRQTGPERVISLAHEVGINGEIPRVLSIALGTVESSLFEMVGGYTAFANGGRTTPPYYISRIETSSGTVIYQHEATDTGVLSPEDAATMQTMLGYVVDRGTAGRLRWEHGISRPAIGKTGTTQDMADGWYIGSTPRITAGAWVGGVNSGIRFRSGHLGNGSRSALPIWADFIRRVERDPALGDEVLGRNFPAVSARVKSAFYCAGYIPPEEELLEGSPDSLGHLVPVSEAVR